MNVQDKREGIPAPGFSDRKDHPEILAKIRKNSKASLIFALILIPLPLIGFVVYSAVTGKMEMGQAALYGGVVSLIFLIFSVGSLLRSKTQKPYDGVVTDKKTRMTYRHNNDDEDHREVVTEYVTVVRTTDGRTKKIVEQEGSLTPAYHYLNVGDKFRYHPQFAFPYELYDKSKAPFIGCACCAYQNPVEADRCGKCGAPLLK